MKKIYYVLLILCFIELVIGFSKPYPTFAMQPLNAPEESSTCQALDVVVLIDQSGSMLYSDPDGFRALATQDIVQRLAINALIECPATIHRLAVGNFATDFSWVNFAPPNEPASHWVAIGNYQNVSDTDFWQLDSVNPIRNRITAQDDGDTAINLALNEAADLLSRVGSLGETPRKPVVILITDGNPYPPINLDDSIPQILDTLDYSYAYDTPLSETDIRFWVVALFREGSLYLEDDFVLGTERTTAEEFWSQQATVREGELVRLTQNKNELTDSLNRIYEKIVGVEGVAVPCAESFYIDPYLETATFSFSKNRPALSVRLQYFGQGTNFSLEFRDGKLYDANNLLLEDFQTTQGQPDAEGNFPYILNWSEIGTVERYMIRRPPAGRWMISSGDCPDIRARYEKRDATVQLTAPAVSDKMPAVKEAPYELPQLFFQAQVVENATGSLFEIDPTYPLNIFLSYTGPDGVAIKNQQDAIEWQLLANNDLNLWQSETPIKVPLAGDYSVRIRGEVKSADPEILETKTLFDREFSFSVLNVDRFAFKITAPANGEEMILNTIENGTRIGIPVTLKVQLTDIAGTALDANGVIIGAQPFTANLVGPDGVVVASATLVPGEAPGEYVAVLGSPEQIDPSGSYKLDVVFTGQPVAERWLPGMTQTSVQFTRTGRESFTFKILGPEENQSFLIHPDFLAACPFEPRLIGIQTMVRFYDAFSNEEIDPTILLAPGQDLTNLIQGQLLGARDEEGNQPTENLVFRPADDPDGQGTVLVADAGSQFTREGTYQVVIQANPAVLKENYLPPQDSANVTFQREDSSMTKPGTCNTALTGLGILVAIIVVAIVIALTGGPGGTLVWMDPNQMELYSIRLSHARAFSTVRNKKALAEKGIKTIKAKKARSEDKKRAVEVEMTDTSGQLLYSGILVVDEPQYFMGEETILYR